MNYYFYTHKNMVFDYLSRNIIAPNKIITDIKGYRTISTLQDNFLFITHKKLNRACREKGILEANNVCPVTCQISSVVENDGNAILVEQENNEFVLSLDSFSNYDSNKHVGAFILGEIPFSRVEKIFFDTQEDKDLFSRPSPDYWYPTQKFDILPGDFNEVLDIKIENLDVNIGEVDSKEIIATISLRERKRAALLNYFNSSNRWQYGKYAYSIDENVQECIGIKDEELLSALPHYSEMKNLENNKETLRFFTKCLEKNNINQIIYDVCNEVFSKCSYNTQKQNEEIANLLEKICQEILSNTEVKDEFVQIQKNINNIKLLITDECNSTPEEIMTRISKSIDVLKALLLVAKNPNRFDLFESSIAAYHVDQITKRRAYILWGMLNGLYGMPGVGYNKDNEILWKYIEASVFEEEKNQIPTLSINKPNIILEADILLGMKLNEERILSAMEIREILLKVGKDNLKMSFYEKLAEASQIDCGSKKKAEKKGYYNRISSLNFEMHIGDCFTDEKIKLLSQLVKDSKTSTLNQEKLYEDYFLDEKKFELVFSIDEAYWRKVYFAVEK